MISKKSNSERTLKTYICRIHFTIIKIGVYWYELPNKDFKKQAQQWKKKKEKEKAKPEKFKLKIKHKR